MQYYYNDNGDLKVPCQAFVKCGNDAVQVMEHPILDYVPTCPRCHTKLETINGSPIELFDIEMDGVNLNE